MDVQLIECKLIDQSPVDKTTRSFNKTFAQSLAISIKEEGMYHAIVVRLHPKINGRYLLVQGRHRLYVKMNILKEQLIECNVLPPMDDEEARMASISENLWRFDCNKAQKIKNLQDWHAYWCKRRTEREAAHATNLAVADPADFPGAEPAAEETPAEEAQPNVGGRPNNEFVDHVAAATGQTKRTVQRDMRLAKAFTPEELKIFDHQEITQQQMAAIASIKDQKQRKAIVALVASGREFQDAYKAILGEEVDLIPAPTAPKEERDDDLTDEAWLKDYCGNKLKCLGRPDQYTYDALLYRDITQARKKFRASVKQALVRRKIDNPGFFWNAVNRVVNIAHPCDWYICEICGGKGGECHKCRQGGYQLKGEKYA